MKPTRLGRGVRIHSSFTWDRRSGEATVMARLPSPAACVTLQSAGL
ncbi:MAG: hypothetical protein NTW28_26670 [Candidatus Solibacter sp.]|nr:hypothetical protein [Candidatus Solibacter sp.]